MYRPHKFINISSLCLDITLNLIQSIQLAKDSKLNEQKKTRGLDDPVWAAAETVRANNAQTKYGKLAMHFKPLPLTTSVPGLLAVVQTV